MAYIKEIRSLVGHRPLILTSASGVLFNGRGAVLLQERADTGDWGFPGGYMEFGETFAQTVAREFMEDAGFAVTPVKLLRVFDHDFYTYPNGDRVQPISAFYLVKRKKEKAQQPKPSETIRLQYFALNQLPHFFNHQQLEMWTTLQKFVVKHES